MATHMWSYSKENVVPPLLLTTLHVLTFGIDLCHIGRRGPCVRNIEKNGIYHLFGNSFGHGSVSNLIVRNLRIMQTTWETQKIIETWQMLHVQSGNQSEKKHDLVVRTKWCVIAEVGLRAAS